jgi:hypothetical protein
MSDDRMLDRLIAHLRTHVAELRRLEAEGAASRELEERRQLIARLQNHLAEAVREVVTHHRAVAA